MKMRIRQHARFSVAPNSPSSSTPSTEVCVLNRSPWDVLSDRPQSELEYQVKIVDNLSYNGGGGESTGYAPDSVVALKKQSSEEVVKTREKEVEQEEDRKLSLVDIVQEKRNKKSKKVKRKVDNIQCSRSDGKRWHCKNEAIEGHTLCEHHLTQLKSYSINHSRCPPRKAQKAKAASAAPADYIYYSGFGPWWGRKRGQQKIQKDKLEVVDAVNQAIASAVADYFTSDDEENSEGENNKGKRTRKPDFSHLFFDAISEGWPRMSLGASAKEANYEMSLTSLQQIAHECQLETNKLEVLFDLEEQILASGGCIP